MTAEMGEVKPKPGQPIIMAIAPGLKKRGKSTGEDFEVENLLLKMDVSCTL